jgi:trehalose synthase
VLADAGNLVIWRCHVGVDAPNDLARSAWGFLEPFVERADRVVFSREQFAWDVVEPARRAIIAPSIDALAPKNQDWPRAPRRRSCMPPVCAPAAKTAASRVSFA